MDEIVASNRNLGIQNGMLAAKTWLARTRQPRRIMQRLFLVVVIITIGMAETAAAQVSLELKVPDKSQQTVHVETKLKEALTLGNVDFEASADMFMIQKRTAGQRDAEGKIRIANEFEVVQIEANLPGGFKIEFDSGNPDAADTDNSEIQQFIDFFKVNSKLKWASVLKKDNRVDSIEGTKEAAEKVSQLFKKELDPAYLKQVENQRLAAIPLKPVGKDETWDSKYIQDFGAGQMLEFDVTYKYLGTVEKNGNKLDRIGFTATRVTYTVDSNSSRGITLEQSKLKVTESEGEIHFDRKLGLIISSHRKLRAKGDVTLNLNGQSIASKLDLTIDAKTTLQP